MSLMTPSPQPGTSVRAVAARRRRPVFDALVAPSAADAMTALVLAVVGVLGVLGQVEIEIPEGSVDTSERHLHPGAVVLIILQTVPLIWRRIAPILVLVVVTTALTAFFASSFFPSFASIGFLVALYSVSALRPRRISVPCAVACGLLLLAMSMAGREPLEIDALLAEGLVVAGAWVLGDGVRVRRIALLRSEDRAATLELDQEQRAREAVAQERRTIARELHDVVAHNVSVIVAKASAARFVARDAGEGSALSTIERAGRSALTEMRRLTTFLRTDADPVERAPQPSLDDVATLVADARSAGLDVALQTSGTPTAVPESLGLSVYRIVQEALTNVMKHTDDAHVDVIVRFSRGFLAVTIRDDGGRSSTRGRADGDVGFGHVGMRERVALFGGELRVGPRRGTKGYQVTAYLPLDEVER